MSIIRKADRDSFSAWYCWWTDYPDEGSALVVLGADASEADALATAFEELFEAGAPMVDEPVFGDGSVAAEKRWTFDGATITEAGEAPRVATRVELDLLEELTTLIRRQPDN